MAELLGTHSYQLDPKGRVSLPARFREAFAEGAWHHRWARTDASTSSPGPNGTRRADEVDAFPFPTPTAARTAPVLRPAPTRRSSTRRVA